MIFVVNLVDCTLNRGALNAAICIIVTTGNTKLLIANIIDRDVLWCQLQVVGAVDWATLPVFLSRNLQSTFGWFEATVMLHSPWSTQDTAQHSTAQHSKAEQQTAERRAEWKRYVCVPRGEVQKSERSQKCWTSNKFQESKTEFKFPKWTNQKSGTVNPYQAFL